jgi:hypothetical protein
MTDLHVARWQKYGNDRLYVKDAADAAVGWVDLKTGAEVLEQIGLAEQFRAAVGDWRNAHPAGSAEAPTSPPPAPAISAVAGAVAAPSSTMPTNPAPTFAVVPAAPPPPTPAPAPTAPNRGRDLSLNRPGETVRAKANEEWSAAKERHPVIAPVARFLDVKTDERAWRVGAAGEEKVGPKLEKLIPLGWRVLHSVPVGAGDSDIDHVLIGPGGVFTINTKFHPGAKVWVASRKILINGQPVPYLQNSRFEGERAAKLLTKALGWEVPVRPALVLLTGGLQPNVTYKQLPDDVLVLDAWDLPRVFKKRTGVLDADAVEAVFEVARWERTWVR